VSSAPQPFLSDIQELRRRARAHIDKGAVTQNYGGDVHQTIEILQSVLATEIVCVLRYTMHAVAASGIDSESVKAEFLQHAKEEQGHMMVVAERINQLGGAPNFDPAGLTSRSASEYGNADQLVDMIRENLVAERTPVEHYHYFLRFFGEQDPMTRASLEESLPVEHEQANYIQDWFVPRHRPPMLRIPATDGA